jgi:hypothetical protein
MNEKNFLCRKKSFSAEFGSMTVEQMKENPEPEYPCFLLKQ